MAFYEVLIGSGFYELKKYVVGVCNRTTDYGALVDAVIDYCKERGHSCILDMENDYAWGADDVIFDRHFPGYQFYPDEYVVGGNCGDVLVHYGELIINEVKEDDLTEEEVLTAIYI